MILKVKGHLCSPSLTFKWFLCHSQAMWLMLQHDKPDEFVIATGKTRSVRELVEVAFREIKMDIM